MITAITAEAPSAIEAAGARSPLAPPRWQAQPLAVVNLVKTMSREPEFVAPREVAAAVLRHLSADRASTARAAATAAAAIATVERNSLSMSACRGAATLASRLRTVAVAAAHKVAVIDTAGESGVPPGASQPSPAASSREVCDLLSVLVSLLQHGAARRRLAAAASAPESEVPAWPALDLYDEDARAVAESGVLPSVVDMLGEQRTLLKTRPTKDNWFDTARLVRAG